MPFENLLSNLITSTALIYTVQIIKPNTAPARKVA